MVTCVGVDYCYLIASKAVFVLGVLGVALFFLSFFLFSWLLLLLLFCFVLFGEGIWGVPIVVCFVVFFSPGFGGDKRKAECCGVRWCGLRLARSNKNKTR